MSMKIDGVERLSRILNVDVGDIIDKSAKEVGDDLDQDLLKAIDEKIYSQPSSVNYRRTGNAKRGRKIEDVRGGFKHTMDTKIAGSDERYVAALNRNSRVSRFNTHFWDDVVKDIDTKFVEKLRDNLFEIWSKIR